MKLNWNFLGGAGVQNKRPSVGGVWIFSGTAHLIYVKQFTNFKNQLQMARDCKNIFFSVE